MDGCSQTAVTILQKSLRTSNSLQVITKHVPLLAKVSDHTKRNSYKQQTIKRKSPHHFT